MSHRQDLIDMCYSQACSALSPIDEAIIVDAELREVAGSHLEAVERADGLQDEADEREEQDKRVEAEAIAARVVLDGVRSDLKGGAKPNREMVDLLLDALEDLLGEIPQ